MALDPLSNMGMASTTFEWRRVKIDVPPERPSKTAAAGRPPLNRRNARDALTLTIRYRGGAEAWWEVKARGQTWRFPGYYAIHDVMRVVLALD